MKGLIRGKYLVVCYDRDELPLFVASTAKEFAEFFNRYTSSSTNVAYSLLTRLLNGTHTYSRLKLIEADTVTEDCFEEEDKEFIEFIEKNRKKTVAERAKEIGISEKEYYRRVQVFRKTEGKK